MRGRETGPFFVLAPRLAPSDCKPLCQCSISGRARTRTNTLRGRERRSCGSEAMWIETGIWLRRAVSLSDGLLGYRPARSTPRNREPHGDAGEVRRKVDAGCLSSLLRASGLKISRKPRCQDFSGLNLWKFLSTKSTADIPAEISSRNRSEIRPVFAQGLASLAGLDFEALREKTLSSSAQWGNYL
jgi:hypothetical protein